MRLEAVESMSHRSKACTDAIKALRKLDHVQARRPYPMRDQEVDNLEKLLMALTGTTTVDAARTQAQKYRSERKAENRAQAQAQSSQTKKKTKPSKPAAPTVRSVRAVSGGLPGQGKRS